MEKLGWLEMVSGPQALAAMAVLLGLLQLADIVSTLAFLRSGRGYEANPLMAGLMARLGVLPALIVAKGAATAGLWAIWLAGLAPGEVWAGIMAAAIAGYAAIVVNNIRIARGR